MRAKQQKKIKVLLVDDHPVVLDGITADFKGRKDITIAGKATNGKQAIEKAKKLAPDVIVLDVSLPDMNGAELTVRLRNIIPKAKLLAFSNHSNPEHVMRTVRAGVRGYVVKDRSPEELALAILAVHAGKLHFSEAVSDCILRLEAPPGDKSLLSVRENEVLRFVAQGLVNKEIAQKLGIGVRTVEMHRASLMRKLKIHTVAGLTRYAIEEGLITL